jgi:glycosyltransferase involved in cell wall biosynthesis
MKILIVHRYFWPDHANCGQILWQVARHYQLEGHQVDVLTSLPSRNSSSKKIEKRIFEKKENVNIRRVNLPNETNSIFQRILNAFKLGFLTNFLVIQNKYEVIISTSVPPILSGFFSALSSFFVKARFFYFCMDIYPEIGKVSGDFSNRIFYKLLEKIDNWSCKRAISVIVHSSDMKKSLKNRSGGNKFKIDIINNFSVPSELNAKQDYSRKYEIKKKKLTIVFAGNIGRLQGLEEIIDAMSLIKSRKDIELVIVGEGVAKNKLIYRARKGNANVIFFDHQSINTTKEIINKADVGLVTLRPKIIKYAYPGKVMTYLEQSKPIITTVDSESELVKKMKSEGYGFCISKKNILAISELFIELADDSSWKSKMNKSALKAYKKNFSKKKILEKWSKILQYEKK